MIRTLLCWWLAIRPKTLVASLSPVLLGLMLSLMDGGVYVWPAVLTGLCAMCLQIGANFANDYYDFKKGADTSERKGPIRMVAAGLIKPVAMKRAMVGIFVFAFMLGLMLVAVAGWPIFMIGVVSILLAWGYTAGPVALAYTGLADSVALTFFGPVAVAGTYFIQRGVWSMDAIYLGLGVGAISTALLTVNNLRDRIEDAASGKRTLVVRFGHVFGCVYYCLSLGISVGILVAYCFYESVTGRVMSLVYAMFILNLSRSVWEYQGAQFNRLLGLTGAAITLYAVCYCVVMVAGHV